MTGRPGRLGRVRLGCLRLGVRQRAGSRVDETLATGGFAEGVHEFSNRVSQGSHPRGGQHHQKHEADDKQLAEADTGHGFTRHTLIGRRLVQAGTPACRLYDLTRAQGRLSSASKRR